MTLVGILLITIKVSIFVTVLSFGLRASPSDITHLFRRPGQLIRALLSIFIVMPIVAIVLIRFLPMDVVLETTLVALSVSPVPPVLPNKAIKEGGQQAFTYGLLAAVSIISVFVIPLAFRFLDAMFQQDHSYSETGTIKTISLTILVPILGGMVIRYFMPALAERLANPFHRIGMGLLALGFLPVLISFLPLIFSLIGSGWALVSIAFAVVGVTVGYFFGGPDPAGRKVLALATASRHPAVAIALVTANVDESQQKLAIASVIVYVLISGIVGAPFLTRLTKRSEKPEETAVEQEKLA
jgi:BASS family bile acid:Na+ symporter